MTVEWGQPPAGEQGAKPARGPGVTRELAADAAAYAGLGGWYRNLGFLEDIDFIRAMGPHAKDPILLARIWRIYTLCWAARNCLGVQGDFVDLGCYDGKTVEVMERFCDFRQVEGKTWWLYDIFDNPPQEAKKSGHGPQLFDQVRGYFEPLGNFRVIKGATHYYAGQPELLKEATALIRGWLIQRKLLEG